MDDKVLEHFDNMLFRGNQEEYLEMTKIINNGITEIKKSNNIRHMILDTWLIIDFFILDAIGKAFDLNKFNSNEFDCKSVILPPNFTIRLKIFRNLLTQQKALPIDPNKNAIKLPGEFWRLMKKEDEGLYHQFFEFLEVYYQTYYPNLSQKEWENEVAAEEYVHKSEFPSTRMIYRANEEWCETYETIDEKWFTRAETINTIRNKAAHSYNPDDIYEALNKTLKFNGKNKFDGKNKFKKTKRYLLKTLEELLKVKTT